MNAKENERQKFLAQRFKEYYRSKFQVNNFLTDIENHEFGFFYWDLNKFVRHLGFLNFENLLNHIVSSVPRHIYCSAARYKTPDASNMKLKSFIDCELIFDLDIDHIPTPCKEKHDKWQCKTCGTSGIGTAPNICPTKNCNSNSFEDMTWECDTCMEIAKSEILFIIEEFLSEDFGLNPNKDLYIVFSGQRGYHIHVHADSIRMLDSNARREIVDYITGKGLVPSYHGFSPNAKVKPNLLERGWRGRLARLVLRLLHDSTPEELQQLFTKDVDIGQAQIEIISQLNSKNPLWSFKHVGEKRWQKLIETAIKKYGGKIDEPVSIDVHRLIRLPGSLHGKTGFLVKKLSYEELKPFDPFSHAQVFHGTQKIFVKEAPQFRVGEEFFGPFKEESIELPMSAAIFLLCKGLGTL